MAEGRTYWWAKDAAWIDRDAIVELGEMFGPAGPLVIDVLSGMAKLENHGGRVFTGYRAVARKCFITAEQAEQIVEQAAKIGALDDLEIEPDGRRFTARISGWQADQKKGRAADRDAARREREADARRGADTRETHADSRPLTHPHVPVGTGQDRTEQNTSSSLRSEDVVAHTIAKRQVIRWRGKPIKPDRLDLAAAILTAFNARAGTGYRPITRNGKPSEDLSRILGAIDDDDRITLPVAERMIDEAFTRPFWQGRPHAGVVFGPKVASGLLEQAVNPAPPGPPPPTSRGAGYLDELKRMHADATAEHPAPAAPPADITERTAA